MRPAVTRKPAELSHYHPALSEGWTESVRSLLEDPSPAVLTTYKEDGSAFVSPVWFRWTGEAFEIVVAEGDIKLRHLTRDPRCVLVVFEAVPPFRGVEVRGTPELIHRDVTPERAALAGRYLGEAGGRAFTVERRAKPGVLLRLVPDNPRVWDLSGILPTDIANPS
jgi:PPOX class probable F420-dependent enzyme